MLAKYLLVVSWILDNSIPYAFLIGQCYCYSYQNSYCSFRQPKQKDLASSLELVSFANLESVQELGLILGHNKF